MLPIREVTYAKCYLYEMLPRQSVLYEMLLYENVLYETLLIHQNLPKPFSSHVDICHLQTDRNTGLLLFSKINVWTV